MPMSLIGDIRITTDCATDFKGRNSLVVLTGQIHFDLNYGPGFGRGFSYAESACVTDFKGRNSLVVLNRPNSISTPNYGPAGVTAPAGLFLPANGLR